MAVYIVCPKCKTEYSVKKKECPKCGYVVKQNKTFRVSVSFHGKRVRQTITGSNLQGAKEIEAKLKSELVSGEYYDRRQVKVVFEQFVREKYLPYAKEKKSYDREESIFRLWIFPVIGKKTLENITPFDLERIRKTMKDAGKSPRTMNYALAVVRQVFNKAITWDIFKGVNPVSKVKFAKLNNKRLRFLTRQEAQDLLKELKSRSQKTYEMAIISLFTGMRAGEVFNLKFGDIDLKNGIIHIKNPKNNEDRVAYITPEIKSVLMGKKGDFDEYIFKDRNGNKIKSISDVFDKAVNKLGLNNGITDPRDKVVFHTLRHTFASWLAINGTPIYTIKELMGHKSLAMTERYSHLIPDIKREAVEGLSKMDRNSEKK